MSKVEAIELLTVKRKLVNDLLKISGNILSMCEIDYNRVDFSKINALLTDKRNIISQIDKIDAELKNSNMDEENVKEIKQEIACLFQKIKEIDEKNIAYIKNALDDCKKDIKKTNETIKSRSAYNANRTSPEGGVFIDKRN